MSGFSAEKVRYSFDNEEEIRSDNEEEPMQVNGTAEKSDEESYKMLGSDDDSDFGAEKKKAPAKAPNKYVQSNLNSSNTDGLFTMANSNSFLSPYEILPLAQENKYLGKFSYFIMKLYVVCTH